MLTGPSRRKWKYTERHPEVAVEPVTDGGLINTLIMLIHYAYTLGLYIMLQFSNRSFVGRAVVYRRPIQQKAIKPTTTTVLINTFSMLIHYAYICLYILLVFAYRCFVVPAEVPKTQLLEVAVEATTDCAYKYVNYAYTFAKICL